MMLKSVPTEAHLARAYFELAEHGANCVGAKKGWPYNPKSIEELFCLAAEMSRYDPRLFSVLVRFASEHWMDMNPAIIRLCYAKMQMPQVIAVIAEFILSCGTISEETGYFFEYLQRGLHPVPFQLFFHHLYTLGGNMMEMVVDASLKEYKKWGFFAREAPVLDDVSRRPIGTHDASSRRNILRHLFESKGCVKLADYIAAVGGALSRQQALLDIKSMPGTRRKGKGRGARWKVAA